MKRPLPTPIQSTELIDKTGQPGTHFYRWMDGINQSVVDTQDTLTALNTTASTLAVKPTDAAPYYYCRAWVNFDGTRDSTGAASTANTNRLLKGNGNVSSVLRNAVGIYTVNFTTAMSDANYAVSLCAPQYTTTNGTVFPYIYGSTSIGIPGVKTSTQLKVCWAVTAGTGYDPTDYTVLIFR